MARADLRPSGHGCGCGNYLCRGQSVLNDLLAIDSGYGQLSSFRRVGLLSLSESRGMGTSVTL